MDFYWSKDNDVVSVFVEPVNVVDVPHLHNMGTIVWPPDPPCSWPHSYLQTTPLRQQGYVWGQLPSQQLPLSRFVPVVSHGFLIHRSFQSASPMYQCWVHIQGRPDTPSLSFPAIPFLFQISYSPPHLSPAVTRSSSPLPPGTLTRGLVVASQRKLERVFDFQRDLEFQPQIS